jgi:hypothetical protein
MSKHFEDYLFPTTTYLCNTGCNSFTTDKSCIIDGCQAKDYPPCADFYCIAGLITAPVEIIFLPFTSIYHCIKGNICSERTREEHVRVIPKKISRTKPVK